MFQYKKELLLKDTEKLKTSFSDRLKAVVAFCSIINGDFHSESDFEILVVIEKLTINERERGIFYL